MATLLRAARLGNPFPPHTALLWGFSGGSIPPPSVSSAVVAPDGVRLAVRFNTDVTGGGQGFSLTVQGRPKAIEPLPRSDTKEMDFTLGLPLYVTDESVLLAYAGGRVRNVEGVPLAVFDDVVVTNEATGKRGPRPSFVVEESGVGTGHAHIGHKRGPTHGRRGRR